MRRKMAEVTVRCFSVSDSCVAALLVRDFFPVEESQDEVQSTINSETVGFLTSWDGEDYSARVVRIPMNPRFKNSRVFLSNQNHRT